MVKIDFNAKNFAGFEEHEDVLLDTGVILAYLNSYDSWHKTVSDLFDKHIINNDNAVFLYVNPTMLSEVTHLAGKPLEQYAKAHGHHYHESDYIEAKSKTVDGLKTLIENEVIMVLEGNKSSVIKQLETFETLGAADATLASIANEYGISILTVDNRLTNNLNALRNELSDIHNVYYTTPNYRSYR